MALNNFSVFSVKLENYLISLFNQILKFFPLNIKQTIIIHSLGWKELRYSKSGEIRKGNFTFEL